MRVLPVVCLALAAGLQAAPAPEPQPAVGAVLGALAFGGGVLLGAKVLDGYYVGDCYSCGCGGCGGACGWCGGGFEGGYGGGCGGYGGCGRRRRSVEDFLSKPEVQQMYEKLAAEDKDQCGLRLVCELAHKDPRDLAPDEIQILLPYRGLGESDATIYGDYDEAAWHGQEGHSCPDRYPLCGLDSVQMMDFLHNLGNSTIA